MSLRPEIEFIKALLPHRSLNFSYQTGELQMDDNTAPMTHRFGWQPMRRAAGSSNGWTKRAVAVGTAGAVVLGAGVAYAAWTSNASGNAAAKAGSINITANGTITTVATTNPTHPGSQAGTTSGDATGGDLTVHIKNTSGFSVKITAIRQYGLVTITSAGSGTCDADTGSAGSAGTATTNATAPTVSNQGTNSGISVGPLSVAGTGTPTYVYTLATPQTVTNGTDADVTIPNALSMATSSESGCQGATFQIPVQVQTSS